MDRESVKAEVLGICLGMMAIGTMPRIEPVRMLCTRRRKRWTHQMDLPTYDMVRACMHELAAEGRVAIPPRKDLAAQAARGYGPANPAADVARAIRRPIPDHPSGAVVAELEAVHRRRRRWGQELMEQLRRAGEPAEEAGS